LVAAGPVCHHVALLTPEVLLRVGLSPAAKVLGLKWHGCEDGLEAQINAERANYAAAAAAGDFDTAVIYTGGAT
jgi:hypothetical protein